MKKRPEATQTLRAGCSKADPHTNTQTDRGDYNTLHSLVHSVFLLFSNKLDFFYVVDYWLQSRCKRLRSINSQ